MMETDILTPDFKNALHDYSYFLDRKYPRISTLKFVCDRYLLNKTQRTILSRGVFNSQDTTGRSRRITKKLLARDVYFDTYNVLFTITNYLLGRVLFVGNDGFLRDTGEISGMPFQEPAFLRSVELLFSYLKTSGIAHSIFLIDKPVPVSDQLALDLRKKLRENELHGDTRIVINPDDELIRRMEGVIATSDSEIIEQSGLWIADIARMVLEEHFSPDFLQLGEHLY